MRIQTSSHVAVRTTLPTITQPRDLRQPMAGSDVRELQRQLAAAGYDPGPIDGEFGPKTEAAVRAYQRAHGLKADGIVGPLTRGMLSHNDDFTPRPRPPVSLDPTPRPPTVSASEAAQRQRILEIAQDEVGTQETGQNGGDVLKYPQFFGRGQEKYCADFVSWVCTQAGVPLNEYNCESLKNHLIRDGKWKGKNDPQPGDLVLFDWDGDGKADHVGIVKSVNADGTITTIEGNASPDGGGTQGVVEKRRSTNQVLGYGYPG
jgi:peptidoglycan hydrolase-like protein with peptidoglycan-binding domain